MISKTPLMALKHLTKYYGSSPGIVDINLDIQEGEVFGFLGPNGAGKSTTIRLIIGLIKPTKGEIFIFGQNKMLYHQKIIKDIGCLPGDIGLYKELTGNEYLDHFLKLRMGRNYRQCDADLKCLQERFNICFDKKIKTYSKGMRQIVGIVQAFMHNPRLLILDEPTSGLDPFMQEQFFSLVSEEKAKGKTLFLSSHILSEVEKACDRVGIIRKGKLIHMEEMASYRTLVGKNVKVEPLEMPEKVIEKLSNAIGPQQFALKNGRIEFYFNGDIQKLIAQLARIKIRDFVCETPRVEDLFFRHYEDR